jgi:hypothetical protein
VSLREWWLDLKDLFAKPAKPAPPAPPAEPESEKPRTVRHPWGPQKESPKWPQKKDEE